MSSGPAPVSTAPQGTIHISVRRAKPKFANYLERSRAQFALRRGSTGERIFSTEGSYLVFVSIEGIPRNSSPSFVITIPFTVSFIMTDFIFSISEILSTIGII